MGSFRVERFDQELPHVLEVLGPTALDWKWCLSDAELWLRPQAPQQWKSLVSTATNEIVWLSGAELVELASHIAIANWGVFLAFAQGENNIAFSSSPQSEGYTGPIQHSRAILEIRAVDGGYFELVRNAD